MKAELIPFDGGPPIPITRDVTLIGRRDFCDIQIDDPSLSKRHCVLVKTDGLLVVRDLATTNGTKVKGQKVRWAALLPEDRLTLGGVKFRVYLGPDHLPSPSEMPDQGRRGPKLPPVEFASPTPIPGMGRPEVEPGARPNLDVVMPPMNLDEGGWREALNSGIELIEEDDEEIIELD
ncbi:FHA domain-containing protein [Tundrisphaera lichenicola]|uniref:FHA domain-containing protein n=1 Tax=Tundrisphaera lichenicola TaxID=2029860 RepID=UPI003EBE404D